MNGSVATYEATADPSLLPYESVYRAEPLPYARRSIYSPLAFVPPVAFCGLSWMAGGIPLLTDLGFLTLALVCALYLFVEFGKFTRRFGIAGIVLYGGVIVWYVHDYFSNWFNTDFASSPFPPELIAKAAFFHALFIMSASAGLLLPFGRWMERLLQAVPEAPSGALYFCMMVAMFVVGISPYFLFTGEPWYMAIGHQIIGGRNSKAVWTSGRTGNLNYNWEGYIPQMLDIGEMGAIFAAFYALLIARSPIAKAFAWGYWIFELLLGFGTGTRGKVIQLVVPVLALAFIKYQVAAAALVRRFSLRAYLVASIVLLGLLAVVQFQGFFRDKGYEGAQFEKVSLWKAAGDNMFSEGLRGYEIIPDQKDFFYNSIPGETFVRPMIDNVIWFLVYPIPRALWTTKPVDPVWEWYNAAFLGTAQGRVGTTIAQGLVGSWYFRYGTSGVLQGGLLFGWLLVVAERALRNAEGRAMPLFMSLSVSTALFRAFRGWSYIDIYQIIIAATVFSLMVMMSRPFVAPRN